MNTDACTRRSRVPGPLRNTGDRVPDIDACRAIADLARLQGYRGILSPSAAADGKKNLNLYIDGRADDVSLLEGVGREPLNYH